MVKFIEFSETKPCFNQVFSGIQLLPYQYTKYVIPFDKEMIASRIWEYFLVDCFGNRTNITDSCKKVGNTIEIDRIQYDLDRRVYLEIIGRLVFESSPRIYYYSNVFKVSSYDKERTTRIDYKCKESDTLFSVQVQIFEDYELSETELSKYNQVDSRRSVSYIPFDAEYLVYRSKMMWINTLNKIKRVFVNRYVYFNHERVNLFNVPDISSPEPDTYMIEANFEITKLGESINPIYILATEDDSTRLVNGYMCNYNYAATVGFETYLFTKNKFYEEYEGEVEPYILDDDGKHFTRYYITNQVPSDLFTYTQKEVSNQQAITTENNKLIQIENGR